MITERKKYIFIFLYAIFFICALSPASAQERSSLAEARALYEAREYTKAGVVLARIIAEGGDAAVDEQARDMFKGLAGKLGGHRVSLSGIPERESAEYYEEFIGNIREVCKQYRDKGDIYKALNLLKYLVKILEKPLLYLDLGNLYLYSCNDPEKAIDNFKKVLKMNPSHATIYTDLGIAYELNGDPERAAEYYETAAERSPKDGWSAYGMKRRQALILAAKGLLIKDWLFLGPFDRKIAGTAREKKIAEKVYHSVPGGGDTQWERKYEKDDYGYVNLSDIYGTRNYAVSYAFTYVFSLERRQVLLKMGSDDGIAVWINSMKVWDNTIRRSAEVDDDVVPVLFEAGWNLILLRLSQDWGGWGFYFRVTDMDGKNIKELIFDPLKNDERADILLREYRREQLMKRIRYGVLSAAGIVIILVSLVMLMLNIRAAYRIKRMREDFTGSITHDLRIPLSSIMAYSERLKDGDVRPEEKKHEYYDIILSEAERLNRYINKILEIFREKKGTTVYSMKNEAVVPLIEKAVDIYKTESVSEDLRIFVKAAGILPDIPLDKDAFLQVIINLLSNADKYSPDNKNIEIELLKDKDYIVIRVKDRGIGISKHDSGKIFDKFYRVDTETVHARKGIGLGLAFVKSIITAHNGMINVEPRRGGGSVFIVMLPVER